MNDCLRAGAGKTAQVCLYGLYFGSAYSLIAERGVHARALSAALREGAKTSAVVGAGVALGCFACAVATGGNDAAVSELSFKSAPLPALWAGAWGALLAHLQLEARAVSGGGGAAGGWEQRLLQGGWSRRAAAAALCATAATGASALLRGGGAGLNANPPF
jgi:hypothetical protein